MELLEKRVTVATNLLEVGVMLKKSYDLEEREEEKEFLGKLVNAVHVLIQGYNEEIEKLS